MPPLHVTPAALEPFVPAHSNHMHILADSILGVAVGVVLVGLYFVALRWTNDRDGRDVTDTASGREPPSNQ